MASTESAYERRISQCLVWPFQLALGRNHSLPYRSYCPWVGRRVHPTSAVPPKPWWSSSIYMPPHPGTQHGVLWNLLWAHSPHWMVGTAFPLRHPRSCHHLDSRYCHNSPRPSNDITTDHWPMAMSSSMMKYCWRRAHQPNYTGSSARHSTSMTGSSRPMTTTTIQQSTKSPSPKASS